MFDALFQKFQESWFYIDNTVSKNKELYMLILFLILVWN